MTFRRMPGGSLIRRGQRALTNISPHQANQNYLVAGRGLGGGPGPEPPVATAPIYAGAASAAGLGSVSVPAVTAQIGDLILCHVCGEGGDNNPDPLPTGAVLIDSVASGTSAGDVDAGRSTVGYVWDDGRGTYFFPDAGAFTIAGISIWRGVDPDNPIDNKTTSIGGNNTSHSAVNGINTLSALCAVVGSLAMGNTGSSISGLPASFDNLISNAFNSGTGRLYVSRYLTNPPVPTLTPLATIQSSAAAEEATVTVSIRGLNT